MTYIHILTLVLVAIMAMGSLCRAYVNSKDNILLFFSSVIVDACIVSATFFTIHNFK